MLIHMGMLYLSRQCSQWKVELGCRCLGFPRSATLKTSWQLWRGNFLQTLLKERGSRWFRHKQFFLNLSTPMVLHQSLPGNVFFTTRVKSVLHWTQQCLLTLLSTPTLKLMTDLCLIDNTQRHTYLLHVSFSKIRLGGLRVEHYVNTKVLWLIPYFVNFCCLRPSEEAVVV